MSGGGHALRALDLLLDEQSAALRNGDLSKLEGLGARAGLLLAEAEGCIAAEDAPALERLRAKAERGRQQIGHALQGVKAARRTVTAALRAMRPLEIYESDGRSTVIDPTLFSIEKHV